MDLTTLRPVDRLLIIYNVVMVAVWCRVVGHAAVAGPAVAAHLLGLALPFALLRLPPTATRPMRLVRQLYPLILLAVFWSELGLVRELLHVSANDAVVEAADRALFGVHPHTVWMPAMPQTWLSEIMFAVYLLYYPLIFLPPLVLALRGRRHAVDDMTFRLLLTYVGCYLLYIVFPVDGPSWTMARFTGPHTDGFFYQLVQSVVHAGDSMGTAFPSSHAAGAVAIAWAAGRWVPRPLALLLWLEALGVACATVYTQNHFAIDAFAGITLALVTQSGAGPVSRALLGGRARPSIPPLPEMPAGRLIADVTTGGGQ